MPPTRDALRWHATGHGVAAAYAWSDAAEEAVAVLEALAVAQPPFSPGLITRDPLFCVPLAGNVRYRALVDRTEAQMRARALDL